MSFILPYIEQQALYDSMYVRFTGTTTPGGGTFLAGHYNNPDNRIPWNEARIPVYYCPSSENVTAFISSLTNPFGLKVSYLACSGQTAATSDSTGGTYGTRLSGEYSWLDDYTGVVSASYGGPGDRIKTYGGMFGAVSYGSSAAATVERWATLGYVPVSLVTDGLSNTVMMSETIRTPWARENTFGNGDFRGAGYRGYSALFNTYWEPKTTYPDHAPMGGSHCHYEAALGNYEFAPCHYEALYIDQLSARSLHTVGVNASLGDGSVRFVSDNISRTVWRSMGTIYGGESISLP